MCYVVMSRNDIEQYNANAVDYAESTLGKEDAESEQLPKAIGEFKRVLVLSGLLYVHTKSGVGTLKTAEASVNGAERQFTLITTDELDEILTAYNFTKVMLTTKASKSRPDLVWVNAVYRSE